MKSLYDRLKAQREAKPAPTGAVVAAPVDAVPPESKGAILPDPWRPVAPQVWECDFTEHAPEITSRLRAAARTGVLGIGEPEHARFFDTETTGLSGGAGTLCFLFADATVDGEDIRGHLLFLSDFSGEPHFLSAVRSRMESAGVVVSYNGKRFDAPLLSGRFLMNRMNPVVRPHVDLLFPARRLFSRILGGCSLSAVERGVLGVHRTLDLPGEEVPDRYFSFLKTGDAELLRAVFSHVRSDVVSLLRLAAGIEAAASDAVSERPVDGRTIDLLGLGRLLLEQPYRGREPRREDLHRAGIELLCGLAGRIDHPDSLAAAQRVTPVLRRSDTTADRERAAAIWRRFVTERRSLWATVELAKLLEHRLRRHAESADLVRSALDWPHCGVYRGELERRLSRLERKAARR